MADHTSSSMHARMNQRFRTGNTEIDLGSWGLTPSARSAGGIDPRKDEWVTKRELAEYLRVTPRLIELQQHLGLPVLRIGAVCRYRISEVEAWLREQCVVSASDGSQ
jgi:hypothetical protein